MPKNPLKGLPFPPLHVIDQDEPIQAKEILDSIDQRSEVSILIRHEKGHIDRGGYFFHFKEKAGHSRVFELYNFQNRFLLSIDLERLVLLINHCSGRFYSEEMYKLCQNHINLRDDSE